MTYINAFMSALFDFQTLLSTTLITIDWTVSLMAHYITVMAASQLLITDFLAGNIGLIAINLFNLFRSTFTRFCYLLFTGWTLTLMTLNWTLMTAITLSGTFEIAFWYFGSTR